MAAEDQGEVVSGQTQKEGVCGVSVGVGCEDGENGFVGVAAAVCGAGKDGACEKSWTSPFQARREKSGVQRQSVAVGGGETDAASAAALAVCGDRCYLHSSPHFQLHHVYPLQQLRLC